MQLLESFETCFTPRCQRWRKPTVNFFFSSSNGSPLTQCPFYWSHTCYQPKLHCTLQCVHTCEYRDTAVMIWLVPPHDQVWWWQPIHLPCGLVPPTWKATHSSSRYEQTAVKPLIMSTWGPCCTLIWLSNSNFLLPSALPGNSLITYRNVVAHRPSRREAILLEALPAGTWSHCCTF